jgi:uncharacterized protein involved in exopolysaccharide biosynthesis
MLGASFDPKTNIVTVSVRSSDTATALVVAKRVIVLIDRFNQQVRQSRARAERRFAEGRAAELKTELSTAENSIRVFREKNREIRNSPELQLESDRLSRDVQLRQQVYVSVAQAFEQARLDEVRDTPVVSIIEEPRVPLRPDARGTLQWAALGTVLGLLLVLALDLAHRLFLRR